MAILPKPNKLPSVPPGWETEAISAAPSMRAGQGVMQTPQKVPGLTGPINPLTSIRSAPSRPRGPVQVATSPSAMAANKSLERPMQDLRQEAYNRTGAEGPMPAPQARFGEARPLLGNTVFKNLQPRQPSPGSPAPSGPTQQSYAGMTPYAEEQIAGAPRRLSGFRGRRPGARYTEGPMKGKTQDQAMLKARGQYAAFSPERKAGYESKARMEDISTPVPAPPTPPAPSQAAPAPSTLSMTGDELLPLRPSLRPNLTPSTTPVARQAPMPRYVGGSPMEEDEDDY